MSSKRADDDKSLFVSMDVSCKVTLLSILSQAIEAYGAKHVLKVLGYVSGQEHIELAVFPASMLATKRDVEAIQLGLIVRYVLDHWEDLSKKALKHFAEISKG